MRKPFHPKVEGFPAWLLSFLFLTSVAVYLSTLNPALFRNDSPETITACVTLGVSHPPSYPLHTLLGRLFSFLPLGNPAMGLNFFAAFLGAWGVCLFALNLWVLLITAGQKVGVETNRLPLVVTCLAGSLCFAFSKSYWSASLAAKGGIYVLQIVLELGLLLYLQLWTRGRGNGAQKLFKPRFLYFSVFIFSLGLVNHWPTQVLLLPALGLAAFSAISIGGAGAVRDFYWKRCLAGLTFSTLALSLYLYLPLRSHLYPHLNFGAPFTSHRFIDSLLRADYSKIETLASFIPTALSTIQEKSIYISDHFLGETGLIFIALSVLGVGGLVRHGRSIHLLFILLILAATLAANLLYLQVIPIEYWHLDDHLLTLNWSAALLSSTGLYFLLSYFLKKFKQWSSQTTPLFLGTLLMCFFPLSTFLNNLPVNDQGKEFLFRGYGVGIMRSTERNALYFAESDFDYFAILYLKEVERKRDDVNLFLVPFLSKDYQYLLLQQNQRLKSLIPNTALLDQTDFFNWLGSASTTFPLYCAFPNGPFGETYLRHNSSLAFKPIGLVTLINPPPGTLPPETSLALLSDFWNRYLVPPSRSTNPINGLFLELCAHPYLNTAQYLKLKGDMSHWDWFFDRGLSLIQDKSWLAEEWARRAEGDVLMGEKGEAMGAYQMSASMYADAGLREKAMDSLQKAQALGTDNHSPRPNPDNSPK